MKKNIYKHFHRPLQLIPACFKPCGFVITDKVVSLKRKVTFTDNCAYDLGNNKQGDWNKLFGVCFGVTGIHKNSIRFGWRWSIAKQKIELCTIEYRDKDVKREHIEKCDLDLNHPTDLELKFKLDSDGFIKYEFFVNGKSRHINYLENVTSLMFFGSGLYFGGTSRAPHKMTFEITKN